MNEVENIIKSKSYSELISDGFKLYKKNFKKLLKIFLPFSIARISVSLFQYYIQFQLRQPGIALLFSMIMFLLGFYAIMFILPLCLVSNYLLKKYFNVEADFITELKNAFYNERIKTPILVYFGFSFASLILISLFSIIYYRLGIPLNWTSFYIFSVIINILLYIPFAYIVFTVFTFNIEEIGNPLKEATSLSKGSYPKVYGILLVRLIIGITINLCFTIVYLILYYQYGFSTSSDMYLLFSLIGYIFQIILAPLLICLLTPLFAHLRIKRKDI